MKYLITAAIVFAALNPTQVHAHTNKPPKTFTDGIVPITQASSLESPLAIPEYKQLPTLQTKVVQVIPRPVTDSSNLYTPGNCTWYAKSMRPDLPNNLGNADTWYERAQAQGIPVGTEPRVGAIGMTKAYMHVAYVVAVNGNSIELLEMNAQGLGVISSRIAPASEFLYVY